jgi:diadenosine tetraphosphate (Ap4A) HIT family hydrolase
MDCPYCSLHESDPRIVFKDELVCFVRDHRYQGALKHSGIIIPVAHRETVFDLTEPEVAATFRMLLKVKALTDAEFAPDGYNVGWNCGRVGGQEVCHSHLHVIPRFRQEPLAGQGIRSHLKSEANRW